MPNTSTNTALRLNSVDNWPSSHRTVTTRRTGCVSQRTERDWLNWLRISAGQDLTVALVDRTIYNNATRGRRRRERQPIAFATAWQIAGARRAIRAELKTPAVKPTVGWMVCGGRGCVANLILQFEEMGHEPQSQNLLKRHRNHTHNSLQTDSTCTSPVYF